MKQETAQHTPGPWRIQAHDSLRYVYHVDSGPIGYERETVAIVNASKQSEANARLIAASPELLSVLCGLIALYDQGQLTLEGDNGSDPLIIAARAAIAATQP